MTRRWRVPKRQRWRQRRAMRWAIPCSISNLKLSKTSPPFELEARNNVVA